MDGMDKNDRPKGLIYLYPPPNLDW